jgi:hypothetical protein
MIITPDSQNLARLPCPIHGDDSGRRRAENSCYPVVDNVLVHVLSTLTTTETQSEDLARP